VHTAQSPFLFSSHPHVLIFSQTKIDATENAVDRAKEGFREVALRGAVLFDVIRSLPVVNPIYQFSWQQFLR